MGWVLWSYESDADWILLEEIAWYDLIYWTCVNRGIPETPGQLVQFVVAVQNLYKQQRSLSKPIIVHCRYLLLCTAYETFCVYGDWKISNLFSQFHFFYFGGIILYLQKWIIWFCNLQCCIALCVNDLRNDWVFLWLTIYWAISFKLRKSSVSHNVLAFALVAMWREISACFLHLIHLTKSQVLVNED